MDFSFFKKSAERNLPICIIVAAMLSLILLLCIYFSLPSWTRKVETKPAAIKKQITTPKRVDVQINDYEKSILKEISYAKKMAKISCGTTDESVCYSIYNSVNKWADFYEIDRNVIFAMIAQESNFIPSAKSKAGANYGRGLMQVSKICLKDFNWKNGKSYTTDDLYTVDRNIEVGCWVFMINKLYLKDLAPLTDEELVIAYNCGIGTFTNERESLLNGFRKNGEKYRHLSRFREYKSLFDSLKEIT